MTDLAPPAVALADVDALDVVDGGVVVVRAAGVEPGQLARAGAEDRAALRAAVIGLAARGAQVVLQVPLVDAQTTPEALIDTLTELARLSLRAATPVRVEPLAAPTPTDPWVAAAGADLVDADAHLTASLVRLRERWTARTRATEDTDEALRGEILCRRLDDAPRRVVFEMLREAWLQDQQGWPGLSRPKQVALDVACSVLGPHETWIKAFRQYTYDTVRRLVLIPTWQCELRCSYCFIPKQDGRVMSRRTAERGIELLLATEQPEVLLQFFGGEALLERELVFHAVSYATRRAAELGKRIGFILSSNGWGLDPETVRWLAEHRVKLELSLDGDRRTQERYRPSRFTDQSSYDHSIATNAPHIHASGIEQYVIMVVHPTNVDAMPDNFFHLVDLGFRRIQINNMLGRVWKPHEIESFARGLHRIGRELITRWGRGEALEFINMRHKPMAMRLNGEVTIDHDGTIFGGNGFLHETEHKDKFVVGHLDDLTNVDRFWVDATANSFLLDWSYRPKVTANNVEVGKVMTSFIKWMAKQGYGSDGPLARDAVAV